MNRPLIWALECFNEKTSDLDLLGIIKRRLSREERLRLAQLIIQLNRKPCPIEMSLVFSEHIEPWQYPTPCQFHISEYWILKYREFIADSNAKHWIIDHDFTDGDIACHAKLSKEKGICIYKNGEFILPRIPESHFWDSISYDAANVVNDVFTDRHIKNLTKSRH